MNAQESLRWQIVGGHRMGHSISSIARVFHVPKSTVYNVVDSYDMRRTVSRQRGSGRPRKTTPRSDRLLVRLAKSGLYRRVPASLLKWR